MKIPILFRRVAVAAVLTVALSLCAMAQDDAWVIDRVTPEGAFLPGHWVPGSNGVAYDNFTWRLGDPYYTSLPHNIAAPGGWMREHWVEQHYNSGQYDNPFYESEPVHVTVNETSYTGRLERGDARLDTGEYRDAFTFFERERDWITIEVESRDFDPALIVLDTGGAYHRCDDFGDQNARVDFSIPREATTLVIVTSKTPGETGRYRLTTLRHVGPIDQSLIDRRFELRQRQAERLARREERRAQRQVQPVSTVSSAEVFVSPSEPAPEIIQIEGGDWTDAAGGTYSIAPSHP